MKLLITGGTGFIGRYLCHKLARKNHELIILSRQPAERVREICGQALQVISSPDQIPDIPQLDGVINLAGEPIADARWSNSRKALLENSRILLTESLVAGLAARNQRPAFLISSSAIGFYGNQGDQPLIETSPPVSEYTHTLCSAWENAALKAADLGIRTCIHRTGLVIGKNGGFMQQMLLPFKLGLGGRLGDGSQYMSWIHIEDLTEIIIWLMENSAAEGIYNATAPGPVTNLEFTKALGSALHRPTFIPVPATALKIALGELATLLLGGQKVLPKRLLDSGFQFAFPELEPALSQVVE